MTLELTEKVAALNISYSQETFPLLDLPELVRNSVLGFLRVWELMNLRIVCKTTKKWVEESHMDKFVLNIKSHSQIQEITASSTDTSPRWSRVKILCDSEMYNQDWIQNPLYLNLLQKLAPSLTTLVLKEHRVPQAGFSSILSTCKALKRLEIGTLDCKGWSKQSIAEDESIKLNLTYLEHLNIGFLAWNEEEDLELFQNIISLCKNLITLKAPHILMASLFHIGDTDDEDTDRKYLELVLRRLVKPVVDYLEQRVTLDSTSLKKGSFTHLDVENLHHTEIFPLLADSCHRRNIRLQNVSEAFEEPIPTAEIPSIETIESLNGFTNHLDFRRLNNLKRIKLDTETSADSAVGKEYLDSELPKLTHLDVCLPEDIDNSILKCLLQKTRPTVKILRIEFEVEEPKLSNLLNMSQLSNNFSNLRQLSLEQWDGRDHDLITLLTSLSGLCSLRLKKCTKITDIGLIGEDSTNPVLLKLKDLKKLWLDCCISDVVLKVAVSQMKLEEFFYSSQLVTTTGLLALVGQPFADSVIVYHGSQPDDCSDEDFDKILQRFKNLKRSLRLFE